MMTEKILITGATGNVGYEVAKQLFLQREPVYAALRSDKRVAKLSHPDIPWVLFDFEKSAIYTQALKGVTKLFLMRPPNITKVDKFIIPVILIKI